MNWWEVRFPWTATDQARILNYRSKNRFKQSLNNTIPNINTMYRRKRYGYRRRRYKKRRGAGRGRRRYGKKLKTAVASIEQKTRDYTDTALDVSNAGAIYYISGTDQGDSWDGRDGIKISPTKMYGKIHLQGNDAATTAQKVRIIIFQDLENVGIVPAIADETPPYNGLLYQSSGSPELVIGLFDPKTRSRFKVLYDRTVVLSTNEDEGYPGEIMTLDFHIKFSKNAKIIYSGGSDSQTVAQKGSIYLAAMSDQGASNYPVMAYNIRLRWYG